MDDRARRQIEERLLELQRDIAYSTEIGETLKIRALEDEHATIASYLSLSRGINRRVRSSQGERNIQLVLKFYYRLRGRRHRTCPG